MVCDKCQKKLRAVITPDPWKKGAKNTIQSGIKLNENKLLANRKYTKQVSKASKKCKNCKGLVHQQQANYCRNCAFKIGICAICGIKIKDITMTKQSEE